MHAPSRHISAQGGPLFQAPPTQLAATFPSHAFCPSVHVGGSAPSGLIEPSGSVAPESALPSAPKLVHCAPSQTPRSDAPVSALHAIKTNAPEGASTARRTAGRIAR